MSDIDGKAVTFTETPNWRGVVLGNAAIPQWVRVQWGRPDHFVGIHHVADLTVVTTA